jgi:hypothetical protein
MLLQYYCNSENFQGITFTLNLNYRQSTIFNMATEGVLN